MGLRALGKRSSDGKPSISYKAPIRYREGYHSQVRINYPYSYLRSLGEKWLDEPFRLPRTGPINLLIVEAVSTQCPTTMNSIVGLKDKSVFQQAGHLFQNAVRDNRNRLYIYLYLRCCHFEMSASTALSPSKEQSWLDERR